MGGEMNEPDVPRPPSGGNCQNGQRVCIDANRTGVCREGSDVYEDVQTCPAGASCTQGVCVSDCQVGRKVRSYVGCEYWSVDLDNYPDPFGDPASVPHAVAISNTSDEVAQIRIEGPQGVALERPEFEIPPNDLAVYTFPRLDIDGTGIFDERFALYPTA